MLWLSVAAFSHADAPHLSAKPTASIHPHEWGIPQNSRQCYDSQQKQKKRLSYCGWSRIWNICSFQHFALLALNFGANCRKIERPVAWKAIGRRGFLTAIIKWKASCIFSWEKKRNERHTPNEWLNTAAKEQLIHNPLTKHLHYRIRSAF